MSVTLPLPRIPCSTLIKSFSLLYSWAFWILSLSLPFIFSFTPLSFLLFLRMHSISQDKVPSIHCKKKVCCFPVPSRDVTYVPNSPWAGIIKLFPARESLVSDTPAGDGKTANLSLQCPFSPLSSYTAGHTLLILSASISSRLDNQFCSYRKLSPFYNISLHNILIIKKKISMGLHPFFSIDPFPLSPFRHRSCRRQD